MIHAEIRSRVVVIKKNDGHGVNVYIVYFERPTTPSRGYNPGSHANDAKLANLRIRNGRCLLGSIPPAVVMDGQPLLTEAPHFRAKCMIEFSC